MNGTIGIPIGSIVVVVGLATLLSRVRFPAAATSTGMGDRLRASKPRQYFTKPPRPTQSLTVSGWYLSTSQNAATVCRWGVKTGMVHSTCG